METKLRQLWQQVFGDTDAFVDGYFSTAYDPDRCLYLTDGETVTSALYWLDCQLAGETYAYLYAVATHPDYRGRGLCHELMARTHDLLKVRGYAGVVLVPQEESLRKFYGTMGYENATTVSEFTAVPGESACSLRQIGPEEYASLRRQYLPEGGLLQEGVSLSFLETYAHFYAGEDFLLAAYREEDFLWAMELLGNREAASGILKTLGCLRGRFHTSGTDKPFAMCRMLKEKAPTPSYLGHAFD